MPEPRPPRCHACCLDCNSHFDSSQALFAHLPDGLGGGCDFSDERITEYPQGGICRYANRIGVTVYSVRELDDVA